MRKNTLVHVGVSELLPLGVDSTYQTFDLNNQEFSFDVDASTLTCGFNGALNFVKMDKDGGMSRYPGNQVRIAH